MLRETLPAQSAWRHTIKQRALDTECLACTQPQTQETTLQILQGEAHSGGPCAGRSGGRRGSGVRAVACVGHTSGRSAPPHSVPQANTLTRLGTFYMTGNLLISLPQNTSPENKMKYTT